MKSIEKQCIAFFLTPCVIAFLIPNENLSSFVVTEASAQIINVEIPDTTSSVPVQKVGKYEYFEITESCVPYKDGHCIPAYLGAGVEYEEAYELHKGMIFKIKSKEIVDGVVWYRVYFDEWLRHPKRVQGDWYIPAVAGRVITDDGEQVLTSREVSTNKRIVVDISEHAIYAYERNNLFLRTNVATGVDLTPTPLGTFTIYKKTPTRYMQGPIEGVTDDMFDLPGVPWNMYFTDDGAVIHGAYWHDRYGTAQSKGCVNLPPEIAKILYDWAPLGTTVLVQN